MFTCAKIKDGSTYLSSHLTANDYYCENEQVNGKWVGKAAERLGLAGDSIGKGDAAFEALRRNLVPDGSGRLTPRRPEGGVRFYDFQCSAQKSVSIMAVTLDDRRLVAAHDTATAKAFAELERFAAFRSGLTRQPQISGNICAAAFRHDASRALDPQLHTHFVVANATWDSDHNRWLALDTCEMFKAIRYAGKVYQNELALECRRLGYQVETTRNPKGVVEGFEIKGVSDEIQERFSKRRAEVEAGIEKFRREKGRAPTSGEIHVITRETRNVKLDEITTPEVRSRQRAQLSGAELAQLEDVKRNALAAANDKPWMGSAWQALLRARDHLYERHSVVRGHQLIAETLNRHLGYLSLAAIRRYMDSVSNGMVRLAAHARNPMLSCLWASQRGLHLERWSIAFVNQTRDTCSALGKTEGVAFDFKSEEQERVVLETLRSTDRVHAIRGCAGAGKTTCLQEIRKGLEASGHTAFYLAPTASAVEVLRRDGFNRATTVDDFLANYQKYEGLEGSVIIVDESSLKSTEMGASVLRIVQVHDARLLMVGDIRQHVSVEAGDFLRILEQHSNLRRSDLRDIRRQQMEEYNEAIRLMAGGDSLAGLKLLDKLGWVQEAKGRYIQKAADAYFDATAQGRDLDCCIAISPTWEENRRFTESIREGLKQRQLLGPGTEIGALDPLDWTLEQKQNVANYHPGVVISIDRKIGSFAKGRTLEVDRIESGRLRLKGESASLDVERHANEITVSLPKTLEVCPGEKILVRRNNRPAGLINGQVLTVSRLLPDGSIETREGKLIPKEFRHFCHGYVVTSYKAQGRTHDQVVIAAEHLDSKTAYVACSRGRHEVRVFTPEKNFLYDRLGRSADRLAATDVIGAPRAEFYRNGEIQARKRAVEEAVVMNAAIDRRASNLEIELSR